ncbi:MAG: hypothetical protein ACKOYJ_11780 [Planctomycetia bacterium]
MATTSRSRGTLLALALVTAAAAPRHAQAWAAERQDPPRVALDPMARAVVESRRQPAPKTARAWLDAAIATIDVDAVADAIDFYRGFVAALEEAGENRVDLIADLGDAVDAAGIRRLERGIARYEPDAPRLLGSLTDAAGLRRRDPKRMAAAIDGLRSESRPERLEAAGQIARSGIDALPALVALLQTEDDAGEVARGIARGLVRGMGEDGRDALLAWLGSADIDRWPGVIAALAPWSGEETEYLLGPALAADAPPPVRAAAGRVLAAHGITPTPDMARFLVARRLDWLLSPAGLPQADSLDATTIDRVRWNPQAAAPQRGSMPTRLARAERAVHLARDLAAMGPTDPAHIRLILLSRLEMESALAAINPSAVDGIPSDEAMLAALSGPEGFDSAIVAEVLDEAAARGMKQAAGAAARAMRLSQANRPEGGTTPASPLAPAVREALVRGLSAPDATLAFEAAVTLAARGGDPPYRGASRVVRNLVHAATSTGDDRAIVAHPDLTIVEELAAGLSRHGYETIRVRNGRDAILAARDSADTVLVILAARLGSPSALETVELLRLGSDLETPPVLVVVDPLDDNPRGLFLSRLITSFADVECVAIVDRVESFFLPATDPVADGAAPRPPRFLDALAIAAGPRAGDPERRAARAAARLARARTAMITLASLGERGWDVSQAVWVARSAIQHPDLHDAAVAVLATAGDPAAQRALFHEAWQRDVPEAWRGSARAGFAANVRRYGLLLERDDVLRLSTMYNRAIDADSRDQAGALLEIVESPRIRPRTARVDAP